MSKLKNKVAVITGGNSGMGLATAELFVREGATVDPDHLAVFFEVSGPGSATRAAVLRKPPRRLESDRAPRRLPFTGAFWRGREDTPEPVRVARIRYSGHPRLGLVATCQCGERTYDISLAFGRALRKYVK